MACMSTVFSSRNEIGLKLPLLTSYFSIHTKSAQSRIHKWINACLVTGSSGIMTRHAYKLEGAPQSQLLR